MVTDQCHMTENPQEGTSIQSKKNIQFKICLGIMKCLRFGNTPNFLSTLITQKILPFPEPTVVIQSMNSSINYLRML